MNERELMEGEEDIDEDEEIDVNDNGLVTEGTSGNRRKKKSARKGGFKR